VNRQSQVSKPGLLLGFITGLCLSWLIQQAACTVVNEHKLPPKDWPQLEIVIEQHGFWKTQELCDRSVAEVALIGPAFGCAWINFDQMKCTIYLWLNSVLEHELLHCKGYDHYLSSELADGWEQWKKENQK
jgi:hypothetical protein